MADGLPSYSCVLRIPKRKLKFQGISIMPIASKQRILDLSFRALLNWSQSPLIFRITIGKREFVPAMIVPISKWTQVADNLDSFSEIKEIEK